MEWLARGSYCSRIVVLVRLVCPLILRRWQTSSLVRIFIMATRLPAYQTLNTFREPLLPRRSPFPHAPAHRFTNRQWPDAIKPPYISVENKSRGAATPIRSTYVRTQAEQVATPRLGL